MIQLGTQFVDMQFEADGPVWRIPAEVIAANRASLLKSREDYWQALSEGMNDTTILIEWLLWDMPWDTVCRNMTLVGPLPTKPLTKPDTIHAQLTRVTSGDAV